MRIHNILILLVLAVLISLGCSENQEEAQQLEQEMLGQAETADTLTEVVDSLEGEAAEQPIADAEAIPAEEPALAMPPQPAGDGYTVQVAGCEDEAYAAHLVDKYTNRGYEPFVTTITIEGQTYYRVRIGLFENYSEAIVLQKELEDKYSLVCWIDVISGDF